jgi:hypothetical protein
MPVYQYLFSLMARLEIRCREIIRKQAPDWASEVDVYVSSANVGELSPDELAGASLGELIKIIEETDSSQRIHPDLAQYDAGLDDLRVLRNAIAHYNPLVHYMSNDVESEWTADHLRTEHRLLQNIVNW